MDASSEQILFKAIENINEHITVINDELGTVMRDVAVLKSQMTEIIWLQRLVLGTIIVAIVGAVLTLIIRKKNNK